MKKVLIVIPTLDQGGGQKFVVDLANGINKDEFNVKILVYYKKSDSVFDRFAEEKNLDVIYLNKKVGLDFSLFKKARDIVKSFMPDVIHTHLESMMYLLPSYRRNQIKLHTVHTLADKENKGHKSLVRFLAYKVMGVVPVGISHTVAKSISKEHKINIAKIPVVYNGVDCKRYDIPKKTSNKVRLVTVGTIYDVKNYSFLVDCFAEVCKTIKNVSLTIVGDGALRQEIEKQIKELNLHDRIHITGIVYDVENYLADADIYVASSKYEGLPISMLEAMSAGLPVISTNVGGVHDIIKDGRNGILVEYGDKQGYVEALFELITDEKKRNQYSECAKKDSLKYDETVTVEGYEKIYLGDWCNG